MIPVVEHRKMLGNIVGTEFKQKRSISVKQLNRFVDQKYPLLTGGTK